MIIAGSFQSYKKCKMFKHIYILLTRKEELKTRKQYNSFSLNLDYISSMKITDWRLPMIFTTPKLLPRIHSTETPPSLHGFTNRTQNTVINNWRRSYSRTETKAIATRSRRRITSSWQRSVRSHVFSWPGRIQHTGAVSIALVFRNMVTTWTLNLSSRFKSFDIKLIPSIKK